MRLFRFYLPQRDNSGVHMALAIEEFQNHLLTVAGGFTDLGTATGKWLDEKGGLHADTLRVVEVALNTEEAERKYSTLVTFAMELFPDQQAIYSAEAGVGRITVRAKVQGEAA